MSSADWNISGPTDFAWTPAELAQIGRAVQAFQAALPENKKIMHLVRIDGLTVLDGATDAAWSQPGEGALINPLVTTKADGTSAQ